MMQEGVVKMTEVSSKQYSWAGWLAIVSAVLLVPEVAFTVLMKFISSRLEILVTPLHIINVLIGLYILIMFRKLLHEKFNFRDADLVISILLVTNVVFFAIGLLEQWGAIVGFSHATEDVLSAITLILFIPFCIVAIIFGAILLRLTDDLYGLLKPFAYLTIASGVCGATVILSPLGMLAAICALIVQGMIFLRANREAEIL